eukprot:TRINITY_DN3322_c0_g2_i1.p1 TRINITY_DN3322_c0_g2~~TRINITY_DN3322_c0_g2_i1.p1  ORF type:complete len:693 (+),score=134.87 TRINITY_DN3322_c0_g2_i1:168-2081(+)
MAVDRALHMLRCTFTIAFTTVLFVVVNWGGLLSCSSEEECGKVDLFKKDPFTDLTPTLQVLVFFEGCFAVVVFLLILRFVFYEYWALKRVKNFYEEELQIFEKDIYFGVYDWGTIASKLRAWQRKLDNRIATHYDRSKPRDAPVLTELNIAQCIMRSENYFISLINAGVLRMNSLNTTTVHILKDLMIGLFFEINTRYTLSLRADKTTGKPQPDNNPEKRRETIRSLKFYLVLGAIGLLIGAPLALTWRIAYKSFRYGLLVKSEPGKLVMRSWSVEALWKFREFNELEHVFDMRMYNSRRIAQDYIDKYPHGVERIAAVTVSFMLSGLLGFIIMLSLLNNTALLHVVVQDRSLLWWLSILSAIFGVLTQVLKEDELRAGLLFDPIAGFKAISNCTHWRPNGWNNPSEHVNLYKDFKSFYFPWAVWVFFLEGVSVMTTPLQLLCIVLPKAEEIVDHMELCTVRVPGIGDVVAFSTCDFKLYGTHKYGVRGAKTDIADRCKDGKMEKSFLSFLAMQSEDFEVPEEGKILIDRIRSQQQVRGLASPQHDHKYPEPCIGTICHISDTKTGSVLFSNERTGVAQHAAQQRTIDLGGSEVSQMQRLTQMYNIFEEIPKVDPDARYSIADYGYTVPSEEGYNPV